MSDDPHKIDTLGKLADNGMGLAWYCSAWNRKMDLTLERAVTIWGRDEVFVRWRPPIKCAGCGGRNVTMRVQAQAPGR